MRAAVIVVGLVAAGGLGAFGAIEAQKSPLAEKISSLATAIWSTVVGANAVTAVAPAEAPLSRPQSPRTAPSTVGAAPVQAAAVSTPVAAAPIAMPTHW